MSLEHSTAQHSTAQHLPSLDGLRGLAVLMVVSLHVFGRGDHTGGMPLIHALAVVISFGWTGVTLFFVLSGFLITGILWDHRRDPHRYRNFYGRRTLRIFPLYYGTLFIVLTIALLYGDLFHAFKNWIIYLVYLQDYLPTAHPAPKIMPYLPTGHLWSLAVEEQFYVLWPFLVFRTKTLRGLFSLCACTFFLSALVKLAYGLLASQPFVHLDALECNAGALAVGGLLAVCYRTRWWKRVQAWSSPVLIVSSLAYLVTVYGVSQFGSPDRWQLSAGLLLLSVFWGALLVKSIGTGFVRRVFETPALRFLGKISYGLHRRRLLAVNRL